MFPPVRAVKGKEVEIGSGENEGNLGTRGRGRSAGKRQVQIGSLMYDLPQLSHRIRSSCLSLQDRLPECRVWR